MSKKDPGINRQSSPIPLTRGECPTERPCPHRTCRHHINATDTCSLDIAEEGPHTLREVADHMGMPNTTVAKLIDKTLVKLRKKIQK